MASSESWLAVGCDSDDDKQTNDASAGEAGEAGESSGGTSSVGGSRRCPGAAGAAGAAGVGGAPVEPVLAYANQCAIDDDCLVNGAIVQMICDPTSKRCVDPSVVTCESVDDSTPSASFLVRPGRIG